MLDGNPGPTRFFCGHHRSGSTWIYRVLRELIEQRMGGRVLYASEEGQFANLPLSSDGVPGPTVICYTNADFRSLSFVPAVGAHVVRDPRDLLVSAYFAHAFSHPTDDWPELALFRQQLLNCSRSDALLLELDFCENVFADMRSWPPRAAGFTELRFEKLIERPVDGFREIVEAMNLMPHVRPGVLEEVLTRHSFQQLSGGRERGDSDPGSHYRKGVSGDWREYFDARIAREFDRRNGDLLLRYGYEKNSEWVSDTVPSPHLARSVEPLDS